MRMMRTSFLLLENPLFAKAHRTGLFFVLKFKTTIRPSFTNDDSLRRMLYLASQRIVKHWHARCQNWDLILSQLEIMFADRGVT